MTDFDWTKRPPTLNDLAADALRLGLIEADAVRQGLIVAELLGVGGWSLVFAACTEEHGDCALKVPWLQLRDQGPHRPGQLAGPTGPFSPEGVRTLADAADLLRGTVERMKERGTKDPLPRLLATPELGGMCCALMERIHGSTLAQLRPEQARCRDVLVAFAQSVARLHAGFGVHGDLKPEHVVRTSDGIILLDPLPAAAWMGTTDFCLGLPWMEARDLAATAEIVARLWGTTLEFSHIEYKRMNRLNGRFGDGLDGAVDVAREGLPRRIAGLPPALRDWVSAVCAHLFVLAGHDDPRFATQPIHWSENALGKLVEAAETLT